MLNSKHQYFLSVAKNGSLSAASKQLYVATSAISRQINRLEEQVGAPLFERHARGMQLTEAGEILLRQLCKSLQEMDHVLAEIKGLQDTNRTTFIIACTDGLAFSVLPELLRNFNIDYPAVNFILKVTTNSGVTELIRLGECDIALQFSLDPQHNMNAVGAWSAPVSLIMNKNHLLAHTRTINLHDLKDWPMALQEKDYTVRQLLDISCNDNGFILKPILTCNNFSSLFYFLLNTPQAIIFSSIFTMGMEIEKYDLVLRTTNVDQLNQRVLLLQKTSRCPHHNIFILLLRYLSSQLNKLYDKQQI